MQTKYTIGITHEAFGTECVRIYVGTELGARRAANKLARAGGHGWKSFVREAE